MTDISAKKPRTFISHDQRGLFLWLSRTRPRFNSNNNAFECPDAPHIRLPYSWYGNMMRENTFVEIDIETAAIRKADPGARNV